MSYEMLKGAEGWQMKDKPVTRYWILLVVSFLMRLILTATDNRAELEAWEIELWELEDL